MQILKFDEIQLISNLLLFATEYGLIVELMIFYFEIKEKNFF